MKSTASRRDLLGILVLLPAILSCDLRDKGQVAPSRRFDLMAPRLVMSNGDSVVKVDSVRFEVDYGGKRPPGHDGGVRAAQRAVRRHPRGIPLDHVRGGPAQGGGQPTRGVVAGRVGIAAASAGTVQWTLTTVTLGDTTTPRFLSTTGIPSTLDSLPSGTSLVVVSFQVADTDTVYRNDTMVVGKADSAGTCSFPVDVPASIRIKLVSPAGNVAIDTLVYTVSRNPKTDTAAPSITFSAPSIDTSLTTSPTSFPVVVVPVSPSGIDSVVVAGHGLHGSPWNWTVPVTAGPNAVLAMVYALNGKVATTTGPSPFPGSPVTQLPPP